LAEWLQGIGEPRFRARQILDWIWRQQVEDAAHMANLPATLRQLMDQTLPVVPLQHRLTQGSKQGAQKFLWKLGDARFVESVLLPASEDLYGKRATRKTLCVSSQVGCAYGCKFCASGLLGFTRNLSVAEIVGQILMAQRLSGSRVDNLVFMGMGEPLANLKNLLPALDIITSPQGPGIGARHITISTSGVVPKIRELADDPRQIRLAISLHGASDEVRSQIMPVNQRWPIAELMSALEYWSERKKQFITLEYILIDGVNASLQDAQLLAKHARKLRAKVNLIPYNTVKGLSWVRPAVSHCQQFASVLRQAGIKTTLRIEKGHDIDAACGQLRLWEEQKESPDAAVEP